MEAEAQGVYRFSCNEQWKLRSVWYGHVKKVRDMMKEPILQTGTEKMISRHVFHKEFTVRFPGRSEWEGGSIPIKKGAFI
jgi:hypothetical protein